MIQIIKDFISGIADLLSLLIHSVTSLLRIVSKFPQMFTYVSKVISSCVPYNTRIFVMMACCVCVVYLIIGRRSD